MSEYRKGQVVEYHDRLAGLLTLPEHVVIDEVIDDSGKYLTSVRYAVRFEGSDSVFVTDASRLGKVIA